MNTKHIIEDFIRTVIMKKDPQEFLNNRFRSNTHSVVNNDLFKLCLNGTFFNPFNSKMIEQTQTEYDHSKLKENDVVLDIGANVGGFGLSVAGKCKKVVMVEPLYTKELLSNIKLNDFNNIEVVKGALSNEPNVEITYLDRRETVNGCTLTELINISGGTVDFLKLDCEGAEWSIKPKELENIKRIEMEVHKFNKEKTGDMIRMLESCNFYVVLEEKNKYMDLLHCYGGT